MFKFDEPIKEKRDDLFDRDKFTCHIAKNILNWKENKSLVVAICGEWGSGKSSMINLVCKNLENSGNNDIPTIINFNPWAFSNADNLGKHFFSEISNELEINSKLLKDRKIANKLRIYANILGLAPDVKQFTRISTKIALLLGLFGLLSDNFSNYLGIVNSWLQSTWFSNIVIFSAISFIIFEILRDYFSKYYNYFINKLNLNVKSMTAVKNEIKTLITKRNKKLVIIIDDIDRLNKSEIRQIFKIIRVNADFPNTIYLLAFDRAIIEDNLGVQIGVSGKNYLEKIVQVMFNIPTLDSVNYDKHIYNSIESALKELGVEMPEGLRWKSEEKDLIYDVIKEYLNTKRKIIQYTNNLMLTLPNVIGEVNIIDFLGIELIRIHHPILYQNIANFKQNFVSEDAIRELDEEEFGIWENWLTNFCSEIEIENRYGIIHLIKLMFPKIGIISDDIDTRYTDSNKPREWKKQRRICSPDYFDKYFQLSIPSDSVSDVKLNAFINNISNKNESILLLKNMDKKEAINFIKKLEEFPMLLTINQFKCFLSVFFSIGDYLRFDIPTNDYTRNIVPRIIHNYMKYIKSEDTRFQLLHVCIQDAEALYTIVQIVALSMPNRFNGNNTFSNQFRFNSTKFIVTDEPNNFKCYFETTEQNWKKLKEIAINKIYCYLKNDMLWNVYHLSYILDEWIEWSSKNEVQKAILEHIQNENIIFFMRNFVNKDYDENGRVIEYINVDILENFVDLNTVKKLLINVRNNIKEFTSESEKLIGMLEEISNQNLNQKLPSQKW